MGVISVLADMETRVSQDLFDATNATFALAAIDRGIETAVKEYSYLWPRTAGMVYPASVGVRYYPVPQAPTGAVANAPVAPVLADVVGGGTLPAARIFVILTAASQTMESPPSAESNLLPAAANHSISVTLPALPAGADHWNVYVGTVSGGEFWNGNFYGAGVYVITALSPISALQTAGQSSLSISSEPLMLSEPAASVSAWWVEEVEFPVGFWPRRTIPYKEPNGQGKLFVLDVEGSRLPAQVTGLPAGSRQVMNVLYAAVHQLDSLGCSILDQDTDVIAMGAGYYALRGQAVSLAGNFQWHDGEMRDMIDDTEAPKRYQALAREWGESYRSKLKDVKQRRDFQAASIVSWGDVPRRWDRL